jgi:hypothetical protein
MRLMLPLGMTRLFRPRGSTHGRRAAAIANQREGSIGEKYRATLGSLPASGKEKKRFTPLLVNSPLATTLRSTGLGLGAGL